MKNQQLTKRLLQIAFLLLLIVGSIWVIRQNQNMPYQRDEGFVFGTIYHVTYQSDRNLQREIEAEMKRVDQALSTFNTTSDISLVNQNKSPQLSEMFTSVFTLAQQIAQETDGAFDITVAPMVNLWGFGFKQGKAPSTHAVDSLRQLVGFEKVSLQNGKVVKTDPRIMLDCSAIAKGYGADVVARFLKAQGIKNYLVEIGGEVVASGISQRQQPWKVGVTKPVDDSLQVDQEIQSVISMTDRAMATSGNYRNFYYKDGKKYAHTIDPKTGHPVLHNLLSATVIANDCATADAYATSMMVMGLDKAKQLLGRHPELMAYLIYADNEGNNQIWMSDQMKAMIAD